MKQVFLHFSLEVLFSLFSNLQYICIGRMRDWQTISHSSSSLIIGNKKNLETVKYMKQILRNAISSIVKFSTEVHKSYINTVTKFCICQ